MLRNALAEKYFLRCGSTHACFELELTHTSMRAHASCTFRSEDTFCEKSCEIAFRIPLLGCIKCSPSEPFIKHFFVYFSTWSFSKLGDSICRAMSQKLLYLPLSTSLSLSLYLSLSLSLSTSHPHPLPHMYTAMYTSRPVTSTIKQRMTVIRTTVQLRGCSRCRTWPELR